MSLYQTYRPDSLDLVKGNQDVIATLKGLLSNLETCPHAFLLTGPTGCGKTTVGRIIASMVGAIEGDFTEVDSADFRGIDTVREIRRVVGYKPGKGKARAWLIDECHKMTNDAQNALLKILEDTPSHVYFILCTTDPQKLISTIKGRCSTFQLKTLSEQQMKALLKRVVRQEGVQLEDNILDQITQDSLGHPRNALQILEQVLSVDEERRLEVAKRSAEQQSQTLDLCRALIKKGIGWKEVRVILSGLSDQDPEEIRRAILGYCQAILLKEDNPMAGIIMDEMYEPFYNTGFSGLVFKCYSIIKS